MLVLLAKVAIAIESSSRQTLISRCELTIDLTEVVVIM